jgi:hypothetical protein
MVRLSHSLQHVAYRFPGIRVVLSSVHSSLRDPDERTTRCQDRASLAEGQAAP